MANSRSGDSVIDRVTRVLASFDTTRTGQTVAQIARRTGLPSSTAHRLVADLAAAGWLERDDDGTIRIGMRLWELTTRGSLALGLRQAALPHMETVQTALRQHTQLAVREDDAVLFLERLSAPGAASNIARIAGRLPLNASSSGLVLLAAADPETQERILAAPLTALTPETIAEPAELRRKLAEVRRLGYAAAPGSIELEATGIAVPVRHGNDVVAALGVVVPRSQGDHERIVRLLREAADGIRESLQVASRSTGISIPGA
ncbi:MAG: IclR family transcriptional regulator [Microbacteriaceae bacterium]|nr:IclR family transcriptional regulator [Microbacteriaceae bacterium]